MVVVFFFLNDTAAPEIYTRSLVGSVRCVEETAAYASREVAREGFPGMDPAEFVERFFLVAQGMKTDDDVTRIEWRYLDEVAP